MRLHAGELRTVRLTLDGRAVRVLVQGSGPPVVLIHGLGLSAGLWKPHLGRLAGAGYRAVAVDLPGFGQSDGPRRGLSVPEAADWLNRLADDLDIREAAWIGHSLGAQQITRLASDSPDRVSVLVLAAPIGQSGIHALRQFGGLGLSAFRERPGLVAAVLRRYSRAPLTTVTSWLRGMRHDLSLEAAGLRFPTLIVLGEHDPVVPRDFGEELLRLIPDSRLVTIEGAGHAVALDPVDPFCDAVIAFLSRRYRRVGSP